MVRLVVQLIYAEALLKIEKLFLLDKALSPLALTVIKRNPVK